MPLYPILKETNKIKKKHLNKKLKIKLPFPRVFRNPNLKKKKNHRIDRISKNPFGQTGDTIKKKITGLIGYPMIHPVKPVIQTDQFESGQFRMDHRISELTGFRSVPLYQKMM